jgi:hypothetical protein
MTGAVTLWLMVAIGTGYSSSSTVLSAPISDQRVCLYYAAQAEKALRMTVKCVEVPKL